MKWLRGLLLRLGELFGKERRERELAAELESHLQMHIEDNLRARMSTAEARRQALIKLGGMEQTKENYRDRRGLPFLETLFQDLRYAARMLLKNPGFTVVAVLTLAIGIGANTAIFSLVNGVLLRPLPYREPARLTIVWGKDDQGKPGNVGYATYVDWKAQNKSFEELALYRSWSPVLQTNEPEQLSGLRVTNNYFRALGVHPQFGRDFRPEEDIPAASHVVILSHGLWQRRFNSDQSIIGRAISLNATTYLVAGVLPADFQSLISMDPHGGPVDIWGVLGYDASLPWACRTCQHLVAIGRLRPGVAFTQATAEMDTVSSALWKAYPKEYSAAGVILTPLREHLVGPVSTTLYILLGAVSFVLLIACANLANLLLARATHREREMAVRTALGAARGRIVRQLLVENCLLAALGAAAGLLLAYWTPQLLRVLGAGELPRLDEVKVDSHVLLFTLGMALLTGILSGLAPALRLSKTNLHDSLKEGARGTSAGTGRRMRSLLVVSEIALSLTLLVGAGLLLRSLSQVLGVSAGFDSNHVLTMRISVLGQRYNDEKNLRQFFTSALASIRALPGVQSAAVTSQVPLGGNGDRYGFHVEGKIHVNPELDESAERFCVSPGYLDAMRIRLLRGRDISESDSSTAQQTLLISETTARSMWPGEDPIGKRVKLGGVDLPWWTVAGVVADVHHDGLDIAPTMQFYVPHAQWPYPDSDMTFTIRTAGPPGTMASAAQQAIHALDPTQPLSRVMPLADYVGLSVQGRRFSSILLAAFAAIALLLSALGIYGVTAYSIAQRTREIGIRMALGAQQKEVFALLLRQSVVLVVFGVALGVATSAALTRFLASMLFDVRPTDPATFVSVVSLLVGIAALACWFPARRAMRVDPMVALRYE
ncbi:MAG TPA: ABC transporter permease [Candidatus Acidoferrum sp.]|nr:ABC transporter permease [Candidatus Acidoferrum sp.]